MSAGAAAGGAAVDPRRRSWDVAVLCVIAAGCALRLLALGQQSLWDDEIRSVSSASGMGGETFADIALNVHGPLYLILLKGWMLAAGKSEAAVRALSAILGALGLVLFQRVARPLVGRRVALLALVLLACSPFHLWYSQEARNYALLFDLGLLAVAAFLADVERRTRASFLLALVATVAACLANLAGMLLLALDGAYLVAAGPRPRYPLRRLIALAVLVAGLLSPWIIAGAASTGPLHLGRPAEGSGPVAVKGESPPGLASIPFTFYNFSLGLSIGPSTDELKLHRFAALTPHLWYLAPAGLLFAALAFHGLRRADRRARALLALWVSLPVLLMAGLSMLNLKAPNSRYAILALAPYLILLALGVAAVRHPVLRWTSLAAVLGLMLFADVQYFTDTRYWRPDARGAGELLNHEAAPGDAVIVYVLDEPVRYYVRESVTLVRPRTEDFTRAGALERWLDETARGRRRVWIVQSQSWWVDRDDRFLRLCRRTMTQEKEWRFTRMPVYRFIAAPRPGGPDGRP